MTPEIAPGDRVDGGMNNRGDKRIVGEVVKVGKDLVLVRLDETHRAGDNCGGFSYTEAWFWPGALRVLSTRETRAEERGYRLGAAVAFGLMGMAEAIRAR